MLCVCVGDVMDVVFSVCIVRRGAVGECFVMQMLYVCVLCASCGSSQCCVLHDLQFVGESVIHIAPHKEESGHHRLLDATDQAKISDELSKHVNSLVTHDIPLCNIINGRIAPVEVNIDTVDGSTVHIQSPTWVL